MTTEKTDQPATEDPMVNLMVDLATGSYHGKPETAIATIRIKPEGDQAIIALYNQGQGLQRYAENRAIISDEAVRFATDDLSLISKLKKTIEDKRKEFTIPINEHLKGINDAFKWLVAPLEQADKITREKILAYRQEQERKNREAEEINRLRMEAAKKEMELKGELTESVNLVEVLPPPPAHVRTDMGTLGTMKIKKFEVVDFALLPNEYKMVDATKLGKVVRAGLSSIPGVRIWEEESIRVTTR